MYKFIFLFLLIPLLQSCGTCIGCNGKLFDPNAAENYEKRVSSERSQEKQNCINFGFDLGTSEHYQCIQNYEQARQFRKQQSLAKSRAMGQALIGIGSNMMNSNNNQNNTYQRNSFLPNNEITMGFNKVCFYNNLGSIQAITISSTSLCPLSP